MPLTPKVAPIDHIEGADIRACYDHILVLRPVRAKKTKGGIELPESAKRPYHYGYAARVGPKVETVAKGDWILFAQESAREVFFDNPNQTMFVVVAEAGVYCSLTTKVVQELGLELPQTDILDVMSRTCETAVPR
jgi:co-chaperonin GroES (HSP10)